MARLSIRRRSREQRLLIEEGEIKPNSVRTGLILTLVWAGVFTLNLAITGAVVGPISPP